MGIGGGARGHLNLGKADPPGDQSVARGPLRWLGLVPVFPPVSVLSLLAWRAWKGLPKWLRWVLILFVASQVTAALFSPQPVLSLGLAMARAALVGGLVLYGWSRGERLQLRGFAVSIAIVLTTSLGFWLWNSGENGAARPEFFWVGSNGIGVLGAVLVWLMVLQEGRWPIWRALGVLLGVLALWWSEAYAAWLGLGVGLLFAMSHPVVRVMRLLVAAGAAAVLLWRPWRDPLLATVGPLLSGREGVWQAAARISEAFPWGGTGPYQYGSWASPLADRCRTLPVLETILNRADGCPEWLAQLQQPWLIAHSGLLHALAETGWVGTFGWLLLWGILTAGVWLARWPLGQATFLGLLTISLVDNVTLVPSPGYAELFYILGGAGVARLVQQEPTKSVGVSLVGTGAGVGGLLALCSAGVIWVLSIQVILGTVQVYRLLLPASYQRDEVYAVYADLRLPEPPPTGVFLSVEQCSSLRICQRIGGAQLVENRLQDWVYARIVPGHQEAEVTLQITLAPRNQTGAGQVLKRWTVTRVR